ncbi:2576_t:CDS:2, partial [Racocetra persica]
HKKSFLVVLGILVLAFAHSLHLLLRPAGEYSYDQPSYTDDVNNPWNLVSTYKLISSNGTVEGSSFIQTPDDNTNLFAMFSTSILAVYFMLIGDLSTVSSWVLKDNRTLVFLLVIFSFFTTIYLLNLFISLLGMAIDERYNEESFLQLRGENLKFRYYEVSFNKLKKYIKDIKKNNEDDEILQNLLPVIKKITGIEGLAEDSIKDSTKDSTEDLTEDSTKELTEKSIEDLNEIQKEISKAQIDEVLKGPLDKINKLIELLENKAPLDKINKLIELLEKKDPNNGSSD